MTSGYYEIAGVKIALEEVIGTYDIAAMNMFLPFPRFTVKVLRCLHGGFTGTLNVCVRNATTGEYEYTCGSADTPDAALEDAIRNFFMEVQKQAQIRELNENDFVFNLAGYYYPGLKDLYNQE